MNHLTYDADRFYLDGKPHRILSGAMHYFRIPRAYWHDRLTKLKACGFNTVETYTCWNLHERREGEFDFSGNLDLAAYIDEAAALGLQVILRPGPYICAEWEFGGLPSWLLTYPHLPLRCYDERFVRLVERYYTALFAHIKGRLACDGGNVIMVQVENEYGSYGDDHRYMQAVADIYARCGVNVPLFTSDGPTRWMFRGGTLDGVLAVANFGSRAGQAFDFLDANRPNQPKMCGEFWDGWFDHWYEAHHVRGGDDIDELRTMLERGGSFNVYMFHGGTNFGFLNGANHAGTYQPTVTSYDYNAPLSEAGDMTPKYYAIRALIEEFFGPAPEMDVHDSEKRAYGSFTPTACAPLLDNLDAFPAPLGSAMPMTMEELGQDFGFTLYRSTLEGPTEPLALNLGEPRDRVHIFLDGKPAGIRERDRRDDEVKIALEAGETRELVLLVENMGRVNYGPRLRDEKGLIAGVRLGQQFHFGWTQQALRMEPEELAKLRWQVERADEGQPTFFRIPFTVDRLADTFLRLDGFTHGFAVINGHNLGRFYHPAGPQKTLYVPAPWLREGENELVVFETDHAADDCAAVFVAVPELG